MYLMICFILDFMSLSINLYSFIQASGEDEEKMLNSLKVKCHNNLAAAQLKVRKFLCLGLGGRGFPPP